MNEAAALENIVQWSQNLPIWQRDALRRICLHEKLTSQDLEELLAIAKNDSSSIVLPLALEHARSTAGASKTVCLRSINSVQHVNALASGQRLSFAEKGLTIIYGANGSGKSGYARILKKACRARGAEKEMVLPNVYEHTTGIPSAKIDFTLAGQGMDDDWQKDKPSNPLLSSIHVFDSHAAQEHVNEANDLVYTPYPIRVLQELVQAAKSLKGTLQEEIRTLQQQTPATISAPRVHPQSRVASLLKNITHQTSLESILQLATLSDAEQSRLLVLKTDLASDSKQQAAKLHAHSTKLKNIKQQLEKIGNCWTQGNVRLFQEAKSDYALKKKAAEIAAATFSEEQNLSDITSQAWQKLWQHAREYSEGVVYPGRPFPITDETAHCVLCYQPLNDQARQRLLRFEEFVKDKSRQEEEAATGIYEQMLAQLQQARMKMKEWCEHKGFITHDLGNTELCSHITQFLWSAHCAARTLQCPESMPDAWKTSIQAEIDKLEQRAKQLTADETSPQRMAMINECNELKDREWLQGIQEDVSRHLERLKNIESLKDTEKSTDSTIITNKAKEIAKNLVNDLMRDQFANEVQRLGIGGLRVELVQSKAKEGVPYFKVSLIAQPQASVKQILSEGEHRCIALAAFLAELNVSASTSGVVFDDPVSSLDHIHREHVVERIVEEAAQRQVIVFTHDIVFFFLLMQTAKDRKLVTQYRAINKLSQKPGHCSENRPPMLQSAEDMLRSVNNHYNNKKFVYDQGNMEEWSHLIKAILGTLRDAWEKAVEEALSPVLQRLSNKVSVGRLRKVAALNDQDASEADLGYSKCSELLHTCAQPLNTVIPEPQEIELEIQRLQGWLSAIVNKQKQIA